MIMDLVGVVYLGPLWVSHDDGMSERCNDDTTILYSPFLFQMAFGGTTD